MYVWHSLFCLWFVSLSGHSLTLAQRQQICRAHMHSACKCAHNVRTHYTLLHAYVHTCIYAYTLIWIYVKTGASVQVLHLRSIPKTSNTGLSLSTSFVCSHTHIFAVDILWHCDIFHIFLSLLLFVWGHHINLTAKCSDMGQFNIRKNFWCNLCGCVCVCVQMTGSVPDVNHFFMFLSLASSLSTNSLHSYHSQRL